jgi:hypothetical protein
VADEKSAGAPNGRGASPTADELRGDENAWIARLHRDASDVLLTLADRTGKVGSLVETFGHADCREIRRELRRFTRYSLLLIRPQFADLRR